MLAAILHGKAGRLNLDGKDTSWRELFGLREDLLTAAIFGRLQYFSDAIRMQILSLLVDEQTENLGDMVNTEFWPMFSSASDDSGERVEPDIIIECENGIIIIEVKPEWTSQYEDQWDRQIKAVLQYYEGQDNIPKVIHYLALGGNNNLNCKRFFEEQTKYNVIGHQLTWKDFLEGIIKLEDIEDAGDKAIQADLIHALALFGVHAPIAPLSDYLSLTIADNTIELLDCLQKNIQGVEVHGYNK